MLHMCYSLLDLLSVWYEFSLESAHSFNVLKSTYIGHFVTQMT